MSVLKAVENVNNKQKLVLFNKLNKYYNGDLKEKRIAIWGLSFKPETDDMREATSLTTISLLKQAGASVKVYDPVAMEECHRRFGDDVEYASDMYDTLLYADALLILTEWKQFRMSNWQVVKKVIANPPIIDGRNIYDCEELSAIGIEYHSIGK